MSPVILEDNSLGARQKYGTFADEKGTEFEGFLDKLNADPTQSR